MRRRPAGAIGIALALAITYLLMPLPAGATNFTTSVSCASVSATCSNPATTTPTPSAGDAVTIIGGGVNNNQAFVVDAKGNAKITSVVATFSDTGPQNQPLGESTYTFTQLSAAHFVSKFEVLWNDLLPTTTSSTSTSSTSSTSSSSTSSTSTSTTTTTIPPPRGPGNGPQSIRPDALDLSSPDGAAVRGNNRLDVVIRSGDTVANSLIYWSFENYPTPWTAYFSLGAPPGGAKGNPALATWGTGRLDVFVRGSDDRLWQNFTDNGGATWFGWVKPFGDDGTLTASPELATRGVNRLNVFVVNGDGEIYEHFYDGPQFGWNSNWVYQGKPDPGIFSASGERADPGSVAWGGSDRLDLFARGADNQLWQKFYDGTGWTGWFKPVGDKPLGTGALASEPELASWEPGNLLVFARGTDNGVYALPFGSGGWGDWVRLVKPTDTWQSGPGATSRGVNSFDVFTRGTDNLTYHIWQ